MFFFFFSSRRRHTRSLRDWSSDVCSSDLAHGLRYRDLIAAGWDVMVVHTELDWRDGLRWGDEVGVAVRLVQLGRTSFRLGFEFRRDAEAVATAEMVYVCIATDGTGKRPIPDLLRAGLGAAAVG